MWRLRRWQWMLLSNLHVIGPPRGASGGPPISVTHGCIILCVSLQGAWCYNYHVMQKFFRYSWQMRVGPYFGPPTSGRPYKYHRPVGRRNTQNETLQFSPNTLSCFSVPSFCLCMFWPTRPRVGTQQHVVWLSMGRPKKARSNYNGLDMILGSLQWRHVPYLNGMWRNIFLSKTTPTVSWIGVRIRVTQKKLGFKNHNRSISKMEGYLKIRVQVRVILIYPFRVHPVQYTLSSTQYEGNK